MVKFYLPLLLIAIASCRMERSSCIRWSYEPPPLPETPPGMILVEGNYRFVFGKDSVIRKEFTSNFYISRYEETNGQYKAYLDFLNKFGFDSLYHSALPDSTIWEKTDFTGSEKAYLKKNYFRSTEFKNYPVLGLTQDQAITYSKWKTDRMNEMLLIREGILLPNDDSNSIFYTEKFLANPSGNIALDENPFLPTSETSRPKFDDGVILPKLRLPTLSEWELAVHDMGDDEHAYVITPKPVKQRKSDKHKIFSYFYVYPNKDKKTSMQLSLSEKGLLPVYQGEKSNYGILHLNTNASEMVLPDSTFVNHMGGSWKYPEKDYRATYDPERKEHDYFFSDHYKNYRRQNEFVYHQNDSLPSCFTGFRLSMDLYTEGIPEGKRKKVK